MGDNLGAAIAREAAKESEKETSIKIATNLLLNGMSAKDVAKSIPVLSLEFLKGLSEQLKEKRPVI